MRETQIVNEPSQQHRAPRRRLPVVAVGLVALVTIAAGLSSCRVAPRITTSTVMSGLHRPWDIAFTPDGSMLVSEKGGRLLLRKSVSGYPVVTLATLSDVVVQSEGGLMGIAVDPNFASNRRIYACLQSNRSGRLDVRVARFRLNDAATALTDRVDIVTGIPANNGQHTGCRPRFGPDRNLWIGTGDASLATTPQSRTSLGGKVLRVNTSGHGVPGNAPAPFDPRIYSYGHRNVQGIAFSPGGKAYSIEHGTNVDDEVNRLYAGANYGWDPRSSTSSTVYDQSRPMTDLGRYPSARPAVWRSGSRTIAPSGGTFIQGERWGGWHGTLALAVLKDQELRVMAFDTQGASVVQQWVPIKEYERLRVVVQGPNGNLHVVTDADPGRVYRIVPQA